jgi:thiamine pyrophosphate-dependent acetolactate synthase large subunit-like protein
MAHAFARFSGRPAIVTATEGPGVTNLATGIAAAFKGYEPVISVSGVQETWVRERNASQDMDQTTFFRPITKWAYSIPSASKVQEAMRKAFRVALTEPRGPVHLEASSHALLESTAAEPIEPSAYRNIVLPACAPSQVDRAYELLRRAERPVFVVGRGVLNENATELMIELARRTGIPVATLQYAPDAFPATDPHALGQLGRNGWSSANRTVPRADVIVAIGAHIDMFSSLFKYGIFSEQAKLVHHSAAPGQIGIVFPVALGITGSAESLITGLAERAAAGKLRRQWVDAAKVRTEWEAEMAAAVRPDAVPVQPQFVAHTIRKVLPRNGVLIADAGNGAKHARAYFKSYEPRTFSFIDDWGAVGCGFPMALGAKLARPDRPVVCASGDMGALLNLAELETAMREKIPVVLVVFNDQGLGNEKAFQQEHYGGRFFAVDYQNPDFGALARVFGAHGEQVREPRELEGALTRALDSGKPAVVDVLIDKNSLAPVVYRP